MNRRLCWLWRGRLPLLPCFHECGPCSTHNAVCQPSLPTGGLCWAVKHRLCSRGSAPLEMLLPLPPHWAPLCSLWVPQGQEGWLSPRACQEEPPQARGQAKAQGGAGIRTALCSYKWQEGLHWGRTEPFGQGCLNIMSCPITDGTLLYKVGCWGLTCFTCWPYRAIYEFLRLLSSNRFSQKSASAVLL